MNVAQAQRQGGSGDLERLGEQLDFLQKSAHQARDQAAVLQASLAEKVRPSVLVSA